MTSTPNAVHPDDVTEEPHAGDTADGGRLKRLWRHPPGGRKKFAGLVALIVATALLAAGGYAAWTTSATATSGSFSAGTATLNGNGSAAATLDNLGKDNMLPGDSSNGTLTLKNDGTSDLTTVTPTVSYEDGGTGSQLAPYLKLTAKVGQSSVYEGTLADASTGNGSSHVFSLDAGKTDRIDITVTLDPAAPDSVQGTSINDIVFTFTAQTD